MKTIFVFCLIAIVTTRANAQPPYWLTGGNTGMTFPNYYLGTNDGNPLVFRVSAQRAGRIDFANNIANTSLGYQTLNAITSGVSNSVIGFQAMKFNTTGSYNTAQGYRSLNANLIGNNNTAIGYQALVGNLASNNTAVGYNALVKNTNGIFNTATGSNSLANNTIGNNNTANGTQALYSNMTGGANNAYGYQALYYNVAGNYNTAIGNSSLFSNTADNNTAIGHAALLSNTTGTNNTAAGMQALTANITGIDNTSTGYNSLRYNTAGNNNTADGFQSLYFTTGDYNTAVGHNALFYNAAGSNNTALGYAAGVSFGTTNLINTIAIGSIATVSASNSIAIGANTIVSASASNSVAIGSNAKVLASATNSMAIGANAVTSASNVIQLGDNSITYVTMAGLGVLTSDSRFKKNIKANVPGLEFINQLNPITYNYDIHKLNDFVKPVSNNQQKSLNAELQKAEEEESILKKEKIVYSGFLAQDVEKVANKLGYDFSGVYKPQNDKDPYGLSYEEFVVPLVKSVQELSKENDDLKAQLAAINARLNALENKAGSSVQSNSQININSDTYLYQVAPNPFSQKATISYKLPAYTSNAQLLITDATGKTIKTYTLSNGSTQQDIYANNLAAGVYNYSLIVNGKIIDSKKMVITK